jgi:hypothetical protein
MINSRSVILIYILTFQIIFGCKNNKTEIESSIDVFDITSALGKTEPVVLSDIASKVKYIRLQSDSTCFIGKIRIPFNENVKFIDNKFFISDRSNMSIIAFNKDGSFIKKYGKKGRGPGEYIDITDFTFIPEKEQVAILCGAGCNKIYLYRLTGEFVKELKIDFYPIKLISYNNNLVLINSLQYRHLSKYYSLTIISDKGEIVKRLLYHDNEKNQISIGGPRAYILDNTLYYYEPVYDTTWRISQKLEVESKCIVNYGEKLPFIDPSTSQDRILELLADRITLNTFVESKKYIFYEIGNKERLNHILYDKSTKNSYNLPFNENLKAIGIVSFQNDIDQGPPFWPVGNITDDEMFSIINISALKKYYASNENQFNRLRESNNALFKLLEQSDINDNPIIMIVSLKR